MAAITSIFKAGTYWIVVLLVFALALFAFVATVLFNDPEIPAFGLVICVGSFAFIPVWLVYGEFRTKAVKVSIEGDTITMTNYLGLGSQKTYQFSDFDGFNTVVLPSRHDKFEYLYLLKNGKRLIKISEFYHSNYAGLKAAIKGKVRNLGKTDYSLIGELKDIFR